MAYLTHGFYAFVDTDRVLKQIHTANVGPRGDWAADASYVRYDVVDYGSVFYIALQAVTVTPPTGAATDTNWAELVATGKTTTQAAAQGTLEFDALVEMRQQRSLPTNRMAFLFGLNEPLDFGAARAFRWDPDSYEADDGENVIASVDGEAGRWIRCL